MSLSRSQLVLRRIAGLAAPLLLTIAGCAGKLSHYVPSPVNSVFSVQAAARTVNTNGQVKIRAVTPAGAAADVKWSVVGGANDSALGQGTIDANGVYTPPAALTRDSIEVEVAAQLRSDLTKTATEVIEVTPGFLQPLTPENAALAASGSVQVSAQLAEVGSGSVDWQLATAPTGGRRLSSAYGTLGQESCQHGARDYTVCGAIYTAPATLPAAQDVYVIAAVRGAGGSIGVRQSLHVLLNGAGITSTPLTNQSVQTSLVQLGSSGGNNNDADTSIGSSGGAFVNDCCGGTLGALLHDENGNQYILSNNHVLAESDQAKVGDAIVQPALIDQNCDQTAGRPVASLRYVVPLATTQTNVDAALAEVNSASVDPGGAILQLGTPGSGANGGIAAAAPAAGTGEALTPELLSPDAAPLLVAKSGRTTGLTCSTIDAIGLSIEVDYYKDCGETQPYYRKTFADQIAIAGNGFSDSGDSGALVVDAANAEPLGLYFAGGSDDHGGGMSIASPIQDVLAELGSAAGRRFSVVGGGEHPVSCLNYDAKASAQMVTEAMRRKAESVVRRNGPALVDPAAGILEIAAGASGDALGDAAVIVYADKNKPNVSVPQTIGGLRTQVIATDETSVNTGTEPKSATIVAGLRLPESVLQAAQAVQQSYAKRLMADPAIFGVGVTQSRDNPAEAALLLLVDMSKTPRSMPATIGGLRTRYVFLHRFHVTRSRHAAAPRLSSCALRTLAQTKDTFNPEKPLSLPLP